MTWSTVQSAGSSAVIPAGTAASWYGERFPRRVETSNAASRAESSLPEALADAARDTSGRRARNARSIVQRAWAGCGGGDVGWRGAAGRRGISRQLYTAWTTEHPSYLDRAGAGGMNVGLGFISRIGANGCRHRVMPTL